MLFWFALFCLAILWIARKTNYFALAPGMKSNKDYEMINEVKITKSTWTERKNRRHTTNTFGLQYVNRNFNRQTDKLIIKLFFYFVTLCSEVGVVGSWYSWYVVYADDYHSKWINLIKAFFCCCWCCYSSLLNARCLFIKWSYLWV